MGTRARGGRLLLAGAAGLAAATVLVGTASGGRPVAASLSVAGNASASVATTNGKTVALVARAAIRGGDRLLIAVTRGGETKLRRVAVCSRSPCTGRWVEQSATSDRFQAFVTHGSGKTVAVLGKSRVVRVTWRPAPPPPLPPATPGHYQGRSSFNEIFDFDVSADGRTVVNLQTGQVNESCTPPAHISGGNLNAPGPYPIAADGSFSISGTIPIAIDNTTGSRKIVVTGRFTGATATGAIRTDTTFTLDGTGYTCTSGDQTWSASKS
ncbi:MAG: hypothetical protein ACM3QU_06980 [Verrucomicrobiota bacterium]